MLQVHDSKVYRDDGTPRRKYEIDEATQSRAGLTVAIVLAIGSVFSLLKNALFPPTANAGDPPLSSSPEQAPALVDDLQAHHVGNAAEEATQDSPFSGAALARSRVSNTSVRYSASLEADAKPAKLAIVHVNQVRVDGHLPDRLQAPPLLRLVDSAAEDGSKSGGPSAPGSSGSDDRTPGNRRPVSTGIVTLGPLLFNAHLVLRAAELLRHSTDPDGDSLSIRSLSASSGKLSERPDGTWHYLPDYDDPRDVVFRYRVSDGIESVWQEARLSFELPDTRFIYGASASDELTGTPFAEVFHAGDGDDLIVGRGGQDVIYGGAGNDRIVAGDQDDVVWAGDGDDFVLGGGGDDALYGESGDDVLHGEDGDDFVDGGAGDDLVFGDSGNDVLVGGAGNDTLDGGSGRDVIDAGTGDDIIRVLLDGAYDIIDGGDGTDTLSLEPVLTESNSAAAASIAVGTVTGQLVEADPTDATTSPNQDSILPVAAKPDVEINLIDGTIAVGDAVTDTITNIENVVVGDISVAVIGSYDSNVIQTGAGNDIIDSGDGADIVAAGAGDDVLRIFADGASDVFDGGDGSDTLAIAPVLAGSNSQTVVSMLQSGVPSPSVAEPAAAGAPEVSATTPGSPEASPAVTQPPPNVWTISDLPDCVTKFDDVESHTIQGIEDVLSDDAAVEVIGFGAAGENATGSSNDYAGPEQIADVVKLGVGEHVVRLPSDDKVYILDDRDGSGSCVTESPTIEPIEVADAAVALGEEVMQIASGQSTDASQAFVATLAASTEFEPDVLIDLNEGYIEFGGGETDTIRNIENVLVADLSAMVIGNDAANVIVAGSGDDTIQSGGGADIVDTGGGDDRIRVSKDGAEDKFDGGDGVDLVDLSSETEGLIIDLIGGEIGFGTETDKIVSIENAHGGGGGDVIFANDCVNEFWGGEGDDLFVFVTASTLDNRGKGRDKIWDFDVGDRIQIDDLLHEMRTSDNREDPRFTLLLGEDQSFKNPGELRFSSIYSTAEESATQVVSIVLEGNLNSDPNAEFEVELSGNLEAIATFLRAAYGEQQF